jgi:hypothetical protein
VSTWLEYIERVFDHNAGHAQCDIGTYSRSSMSSQYMVREATGLNEVNSILEAATKDGWQLRSEHVFPQTASNRAVQSTAQYILFFEKPEEFEDPGVI